MLVCLIDTIVDGIFYISMLAFIADYHTVDGLEVKSIEGQKNIYLN